MCGHRQLGFATRTLSGQAQATQAHAAEFQQDVLPVLAKSCLGCHNDKAQAGKLNLEPLRDPRDHGHARCRLAEACSKR